MNANNKKTPNQTKDFYPSRSSNTAHLIQRQEPTLYAANAGNCPIDYGLAQQYEQQGFLILEDVFTEKEVRYFQQELECMRNDERRKVAEETITEPGSGDIRSIFNVHENNALFKKLACDIRLAGLAQYLLDDDIYIHQSRVNYKPEFRGKEFYWHSDFETWHVEDGMPRMRALSMSITLTENYQHNGPLMLIPNSHKDYVVCEGDTPTEHYKSSLKKQEYGVPSDSSLHQLLEKGGEIVTATGKPGSVIIFDCNIMHGSNSNITPHPRSNVFFVYNAMSNRVTEPFSNNPARPEYICARKHIQAIDPQTVQFPPD
ncbi:MAG: ectoine hydroxylase [Gammaproteobacteria bacterium]